MGAHRNVFENNVILDNGVGEEGKLRAEPILIQGVHRDLQFRGNTIGFSKATQPERAAVRIAPASTGLVFDGNDLRNVGPAIKEAGSPAQ
jgi:hypothetical protein